MKLQFDPDQPFQLAAVAAVTDLFDGQPQGPPEYSVIDVGSVGSLFPGQARTELGVGNRLLVAEAKLRENLRAVQACHDIEVADPSEPLEAWELFDGPANRARPCPHFSVEMETGTGKTYVYLRTIFQLSQRYGFQKFIIVVPSVAIREGVLKNIEITADHFRALYNNLPFEHFVYDAKKVNRLRHFATSNTLQILVRARAHFSHTAGVQRTTTRCSGRASPGSSGSRRGVTTRTSCSSWWVGMACARAIHAAASSAPATRAKRRTLLHGSSFATSARSRAGSPGRARCTRASS